MEGKKIFFVKFTPVKKIFLQKKCGEKNIFVEFWDEKGHGEWSEKRCGTRICGEKAKN